MTALLRSTLERVTSPGSLLPEEEAHRWSVGGRAPAAVVAPSTEEEVARVLSLAKEEGWRVLPAGEGSWLVGAGCETTDLVVSTRRIVGIREYEPADLTMTTGAGISLAALEERTRAHNQWLPLDPPGGWKGSVGGAVATGVGGPLQHAYGMPRDLVLGVSIVSGDARVLRWGGRVVKNVAGFDLARLCVGSRGMLGVITSVSVRLFPLPASDVTLVLRGGSARDLLPEAMTLAGSPLPITAVELLDPLPEREGEGGGGAGVVLRLLGSEDEVAAMCAGVEAELASGAVGPMQMAKSPGSSGIAGALRLEGGDSQAFHRNLGEWERGWDLVFRMALLPARIALLLDAASDLKGWSSDRWGEGAVRLGMTAHVGAGVARVAVDWGKVGRAALGPWIERLFLLREFLETEGGSLVLSHGPQALMAEVGVWGSPEPGEVLTQGLRRAFDPEGILVSGLVGP